MPPSPPDGQVLITREKPDIPQLQDHEDCFKNITAKKQHQLSTYTNKPPQAKEVVFPTERYVFFNREIRLSNRDIRLYNRKTHRLPTRKNPIPHQKKERKKIQSSVY